jgi:hypothetical protein
MRTLLISREQVRPRTCAYTRISGEIRELGRTYGTLVDALRGITRPDARK